MPQFNYKYPTSKKINTLFHFLCCIGLVFVVFNPHQSIGLIERIIATIIITIIILIIIISLYIDYSIYKANLKFNQIIIDEQSISFPRLPFSENIKWEFKYIGYIRFDFHRKMIKHYYIELSKSENETYYLYKSWMKVEDFEQPKKILIKKDILIKDPI